MRYRIKILAALCLATSLFAATPHDQNAAILSIQDLIARGELDSASRQLSTALVAYPKSGGLYNLRGIVNIQQGRTTEAESDFAKAIDLDPGLLSAYLNLGRVYQSRAGSEPVFADKAVAAYERALKISPQSNEAHYQLALLNEWRGSFAQSLAHLSALSAPETKQARVLALKCADLAALGRAAQAGNAAQELVKASDLQEDDVLSILPVLEKNGKDELTSTIIAGLAARGLASSEALQHLAGANERLGQFASARGTLEQIARTKPADAAPLIDLARVAYKQGDREGALGYLAHARDLDPRNPTVHFVFGMIALEMRLPLEAKASVSKALEIEPDRPDFNYGMAIVLLHGHDTSDAIPYFQKLLSLKKDDARGHYGLGIAYYYSGNYDQSKKEMLEAETSAVTASGAYYFLGRIAKLGGDEPEAEAQFRQSLQKDPGYADAHAELALILIHSRRYTEAKKELDRALQLDPENFSGNTNLLVLYQRTKDPRASAQADKLHTLEKKRDDLQELLYRRIEVRPY